MNLQSTSVDFENIYRPQTVSCEKMRDQTNIRGLPYMHKETIIVVKSNRKSAVRDQKF